MGVGGSTEAQLLVSLTKDSSMILRPVDPSDQVFLRALEAQGLVHSRVGRLGAHVDPPGFVRIAIAESTRVGIVGVVRSCALNGNDYELFCVIDEAHGRRGFGLHASQLAVADFGQTSGAQRLLACVAPENTAGARLAELLGFIPLPERRGSGELIFALGLV